LVTTFGTLPLIALPANLLAAPFVGPLTVWGLVASLVGGVLGPGPAWWLELPTLSMLRGVEFLARSAATVSLAIDGRAAVLLGIGGLVMVLVTRLLRWRAGRLALRGRRVHREGQRPDPARP
jgi:competence protein ComEC